MLDDGWEVYWPQSVQRVGDLYFLAHMARERDLGWSEDLGNVYLLVLDERFNIVEHHQLTHYEVADVGAMRPFIAVQGDVMILVYDYLIRPHGLNIVLDLEAIESGNRVPIADAGKDTSVVATEPSLLDGRGSWDPNDDPLTYAWAVVSVPDGSALTTADVRSADGELALFTPDLVGDYVFSLTVSDGQEQDSSETTVSAREAVAEALLADRPPVAVAAGPSRGFTGTRLQLDATGSSDPDGDALTVAWRFLAVPDGSSVRDTALDDPVAQETGFTPDAEGDYELLLVVSDGKLTSVDTLVVPVIGPYLGCSARPGPALTPWALALVLGLTRRRTGVPGPSGGKAAR